MKLFIAALGTETNTFSPLPTGRRNFEETLLVRREASLSSQNYFVLPVAVWRQHGAAAGFDVIESLSAFAQPAGRTVQRVWEELRDVLLADLTAAGPVDIVLLNLHGAMASDDCDDCEGELVEMVRAIVGPDTVIGVELDLHCHLTDRIVSAATAIVLYKEYPHIDVKERAAELFDICREAAAGRVKPVMAVADCRSLGVWRTPDAPVRALVDWMVAKEGEEGVLSVSFCHGFPWADVPDVGAKTLVVTDGDAALAAETAKALRAEVLALNGRYATPLLSVEETCRQLAALEGCTVVADVSDNAGGGAASDSTFLLEGLIAARLPGVLFGLVWDPAAVRICFEAGEGVRLPLRVGGKVGPLSGQPVDLDVTVLKLLDEGMISFGSGRQPIGAAALLDAGGLHIVINSIRSQTFDPDGYSQFGIEPSSYRVVVAKSAQHFHAGFAPIADRILYTVAPGTVSPDFRRLDLPRAGRPLWPQVDDPFEGAAV